MKQLLFKKIYRRFLAIILILLSFSICILFHLSKPSHNSNCDATNFLESNAEKFQVSATKVVVKPWRGEHHIYGIFMVPDEYKETPFFVLTVKGAGRYCKKPFGNSQYYDGVKAKPGTHLIRDYIRTRLGLRLIFKGLFHQINDKQNWTLTFPVRS